MNHQNTYLDKNHPRIGGIRSAPHHSILYSSKTKFPDDPFELVVQTTHPVPISSISFQNMNISDPATSTILTKQKIENEKSVFKFRVLKENQKKGIISNNMKKFIELSQSDPSPNVSTEFDWHFQGGNLEALKIDDKVFLAQSSMCDQYALRLLKPSSLFRQIDLKLKFKYLSKSYGYEIISSKSFVGVRRTKTVNFLDRWQLSIDNLEVEAPIEFKWENDIAASTLTNDHLIFIDDESNLVSSNIARLQVDSRIKLLNNVSNNNFPFSIESRDKNVISFTNLKSLNLVDFRNEKVNKIFDQSNFVMTCEDLSYHKKSLDDNLIYLASSHQLYGIDLRKPNSLLMQWNHQLVMQPTILKQVKYGDHELICLSSNLQGDLKIFNCVKGNQDNSWRINRLPVKPRNIQQSHHRLKEKSVLLLSKPIEHRVSLSTTGIAMVTDMKNERIKLFTQNSIGDVFKSYLLCDKDIHEKDTRMVKNFEEWDKALEVQRDPLEFLTIKERLERKELMFTDVQRLNGLAKVMRCEKLQLEENDWMNESTTKTKKVPSWKTCIEDTKEYRDVLSQLLLKEWDLQIEDTQPHVFADALKAKLIEKNEDGDKVTRWLEATTVDDELSLKEEDECSNGMTQSFTFDPIKTSTQTTEAPKKKARMAQKVKGF